MARALHFSNGSFGVRTNRHGLVDEVYFPHVGLERHSRGTPHRIGVRVDDCISWIDDPSWSHKAFYSHGAFIGQRTLVNQALGLIIELEDVVQKDDALMIRNVHIINTRSEQRAVTVFLHQAFSIGRETGTDTAQYIAEHHAIVHYAGARAFAASGMTDVGQRFDQHTVGRYGNGLDGTWRDAEDGELSGADHDYGLTDSVMRFSLMIGGLSSRRVHYWLTAGESISAALSLASAVSREGVHGRVEGAIKWRRKWLSPAFKVIEQLPSQYRRSFLESLISLQAATDGDGAIISLSTASTPIFCSPRTGAFAVWPLARLGYKVETRGFLDFWCQRIADEGFLLNAYGADGTTGPMRHPYSGELPPLQSDQTALVLFVFSQVAALNIAPGLLSEYCDALVKPAADFLVSFTESTGLPKPSYDFSDTTEEVSTYTVGATYAALLAAAELAEQKKDQECSVKWRMTAEDMYHAFREHMFDEDGVIRHALDDDSVSISGLFGAFMFGLVDMDEPCMARTVEEIERTHKHTEGLFSTGHAGHGVDYVASLWMAQYYMEAGREAEAYALLDIVRDDITTGTVDSSADATWVHAEYLNTLLDTLTRT